MMEQDELIRKNLLVSLQGRNAHLSFEEAVKNFPEGQINKKISGATYSCWELVEHMRIAQWDILEFTRNPDYTSPPWPKGYWPKEKGDLVQWERTVNHFLMDRKALEDLVQDSTIDLYSPIPHAPDYTIFREIVLVIDHNSYHLGQLVIMRKVLGIWPA